eukprot:COSAG02_NODE_4959_length_4781_cov_2.142674_2_plen_105_part_00
MFLEATIFIFVQVLLQTFSFCFQVISLPHGDLKKQNVSRDRKKRDRASRRLSERYNNLDLRAPIASSWSSLFTKLIPAVIAKDKNEVAIDSLDSNVMSSSDCEV